MEKELTDQEWEVLPDDQQLAEIARLRKTITRTCSCDGKVGIMHTCMSCPFGNWFAITCIKCCKGTQKYRSHSGLVRAIEEWNNGIYV